MAWKEVGSTVKKDKCLDPTDTNNLITHGVLWGCAWDLLHPERVRLSLELYVGPETHPEPYSGKQTGSGPTGLQ